MRSIVAAIRTSVLLLILSFLLGKSDLAPAQTIINIPPSPPPISAGADTVVNLLPSGVLHNFFDAENGSRVNLLGGTAYSVFGRNGSETYMTLGQVNDLVALQGAYLNVAGGRIGRIQAESIVDISGGRMDLLFDIGDTAEITITGGAIERIDVRNSLITLNGSNFSLNGVPIAGLDVVGNSKSINMPVDSVLTGTFADGREFAHHNALGYSEPFHVNLVRSPAPSLPSPPKIYVANESDIEWIGSGQTAIVAAGGIIGQQFRAGLDSRVEIKGGRIEEAFHAVGTDIVMTEGLIQRRFNAYEGTNLTVEGGTLEGDSRFYHGSTLDVRGGRVDSFQIRAGATANIHSDVYGGWVFAGGTINVFDGAVQDLGGEGEINFYGGHFIGRLDAESETASVNLHGGTFADFFEIRNGAELAIHATEFRLNGIPVSGLAQTGDVTSIGFASGSVLSGVFVDGTPFIFADEAELPSSIKLIRSDDYTAGSAIIQVPSDAAPNGVYGGQTLILNDGGALPTNFTAIEGSTVSIHGGTVGNNFEAVGANINISDGQVGTIDAFTGTTVNIDGAAKWDGVNVYQGAVANISGDGQNGGGSLRAMPGSALNIQRGTIAGAFHADNAKVNIAGGTIAQYQQKSSAVNHSQVTISGGFIEELAIYDKSSVQVDGGTIHYLQVAGQAQAEIRGGNVEWLAVDHGSTAEVSSGILGDTDNFTGGTTRIRGGALGDSHEWLGGRVELHGYDFQVDGVPVAGLESSGSSVTLNYTPGAMVTGTFSDGTPFNISQNDNFQSVFIQNGVLRLVKTESISSPSTVIVPDDPVPFGASAGQTVVLNDGGALGNNFLAGHDSILQINGGAVGNNFEAERSNVTITGGAVGERLDVFNGAVVTLSGGSIGREFEVHDGGTLNITGGQAGPIGKAYGGVVNLSGGSIGYVFEAYEGSTINISGGFIESEFAAGSGSTVNISGGEIGTNFKADAGSKIEISGGHILDLRGMNGSDISVAGGNVSNIEILAGARATFSGGRYGDSFGINGNAEATLHGLDFKVDGVPLNGLALPGNQATFSLLSSQLFTGTFADGTPFAFTTNDGDGIGNLTLVRSADLSPAPAIIQVSGNATQGGVRAGQRLELLEGGNLGSNFNAGAGSIVNILGGAVGVNFEAVGAIVNIEAGEIGNNFDAIAESEINIRGGKIGSNFEVYAQSILNMTGGAVSQLRARNDSTINIAGGQLGTLQAGEGSATNWYGGSISSLSVSGSETTLTIHGIDFKLDGAVIAGLGTEGESLQYNLPMGSVFTAILSDGTPIVLGPFPNPPQIANGTLTLVRSAVPEPLDPAFQHIVDDNGPWAIGTGQRLLLDANGQLANNFVAGDGSILEIRDGSIGIGLKVLDANLIVTGGEIGSGISMLAGAHAEIRGGQLPNSIHMAASAEVDIYGTSFLLNNQPIAGLDELGDVAVLPQREGQLLKAILADGSVLEWRLQSASCTRCSPFGINPLATLRVHVVPEPTTLLVVLIGIAGIAVADRPLTLTRRYCGIR